MYESVIMYNKSLHITDCKGLVNIDTGLKASDKMSGDLLNVEISGCIFFFFVEADMRTKSCLNRGHLR